eukprot:gb/GECG01004934.1/.p1 GENE.gb/GECG01004934.1/~~gb/GECG01004934.1/.p1  ORF type:complete len:973 (+),score=246.74 gb/GECG01004934.1/:1-2919(+)
MMHSRSISKMTLGKNVWLNKFRSWEPMMRNPGKKLKKTLLLRRTTIHACWMSSTRKQNKTRRKPWSRKICTGRKKLDEKRKEYDQLLQTASTHAEIERLKEQRDKEIEQLEQKKDTEKQRQHDRLRKRLEARRKRKEEAMKRRKQKEARQPVAKEDMSSAAAPGQQMSERERTRQMISRILESELSRDPSLENRKGEIVERVLQEKHDKQRNDKLAEQYTEKTQALRDTLQELQYSKQEEREDLVAKVQNGLIPEDSLDGQLQELHRKYERRQQEAQNDVSERMDSKHSEELLKLRQKQLSELHDMLEEFAPEDDVVRREAEKANKETEQLQEFQSRLRKEKEERIAKIKEERRQAEEEIRRKNEEQIRELEQQMEEEKKRHERKVQKQKEEMQARIEEERKKREEEAAQLDENEKERIMKQFEQEKKVQEEKRDAERQRQYERMQRKLAARKAKLQEQRRKELEQKRESLDQKEAQEKQASRAKEQAFKDRMEKKPEPPKRQKSARQLPSVAEEPSRSSSHTRMKAPASGSPSKETFQQLQSMSTKLEQVEKVINNLFEHFSQKGKQSGQDPTNEKPFVDSKDILSVSQLSEREAPMLTFIQNMSSAVLGSPAVSELHFVPVEKLQDYSGSAQYAWNGENRTIYIPRRTLASSGECTALVNNFTANYSLDPRELKGEAFPNFNQELTRSMRLTSQYLISAPRGSVQSTQDSQNQKKKGLLSERSRMSLLSRTNTLKNVFDQQDSSGDGTGSLSELSEDEEVVDSYEPQWPVGSLSDRLHNIGMGENQSVQQYLADLEKSVLDAPGETEEETDEDEITESSQTERHHHKQQSVDAYRQTLQQEIQQLQDRISSTSEEIVKNLDKQNSLEEQLVAAKDELTSLQNRQSEDDSESNENAISRARVQIEKIEKQLKKCTEQHSSLSKRMESLEQMLETRTSQLKKLDNQSLSDQYETITQETGGVAAATPKRDST